MDGPFFGPDPAQLAVAGQPAPEARHVTLEFLQRPPDDQRGNRPNACDANLRAAAEREGEAVALDARLVGLEDHVGRRVIRIGVHRIGTVQLARGREADVKGYGLRDGGGHGRQRAIKPPSMTSAVPVTKAASSEAR